MARKARKERPLPYFLDRLNYFLIDLGSPLSPLPSEAPERMPLAQEGQEYHRDNAYAILEGRDSLDLRTDLDAMGLSTEPDPCVRALRYWIMYDRLWYEDPEAQLLLRALPADKQQALLAFSHQHWPPRQSRWTWATLPRRIAKDQMIFRDIVKVGPTIAGVAPTSDPKIAPLRYPGESKAQAKKIYDEYHRQASFLLGIGIRPPKAWTAAMRAQGWLNTSGRAPAAPLLTDREAVYHWFAHALRNLCRYRNAHTPLPWRDNDISCQRACERELQKLLT